MDPRSLINGIAVVVVYTSLNEGLPNEGCWCPARYATAFRPKGVIHRWPPILRPMILLQWSCEEWSDLGHHVTSARPDRRIIITTTATPPAAVSCIQQKCAPIWNETHKIQRTKRNTDDWILACQNHASCAFESEHDSSQQARLSR